MRENEARYQITFMSELGRLLRTDLIQFLSSVFLNNLINLIIKKNFLKQNTRDFPPHGPIGLPYGKKLEAVSESDVLRG